MNIEFPNYASPDLVEKGTVVKKVFCVSNYNYGQQGRAAIDPEELYEYEL
ncbi:MAG: hypothetical protein IJU69_06430 [Bacteroidales bacterium]|nr:hypothetical protein [Bacteroidales bacterium]